MIFSMYTVHQVLDRHIPEKVVTVMPKDKLFINIKVRQRNRIHKTAKSKNCLNRWSRFRQIRNEIISMVRNAKEQYKLITNTRQMVENYKIYLKTVVLFNTHKSIPPVKENG